MPHTSVLQLNALCHLLGEQLQSPLIFSIGPCHSVCVVGPVPGSLAQLQQFECFQLGRPVRNPLIPHTITLALRIPALPNDKFTGRRRTTFEFRTDAASRSGATPCYPLFATTRTDSYRSQRLEVADFARTIIPMPIRIAKRGITTAGAPIVLIASERK